MWFSRQGRGLRVCTRFCGARRLDRGQGHCMVFCVQVARAPHDVCTCVACFHAVVCVALASSLGRTAWDFCGAGCARRSDLPARVRDARRVQQRRNVAARGRGKHGRVLTRTSLKMQRWKCNLHWHVSRGAWGPDGQRHGKCPVRESFCQFRGTLGCVSVYACLFMLMLLNRERGKEGVGVVWR